MYYEDVKIKRNETVSGLASAYGYHPHDWRKIWGNPRNAALVKKRGEPKKIQVGDVIYVPIGWKMKSKDMSPTKSDRNRFRLEVVRSGARNSKRIRWVQTVFQDNYLADKTTRFCVDACPPDDNEPFYWTNIEINLDPSRQYTFRDKPGRYPPPKDRTTAWRAVLSLAVVTNKRVTIFESIVWGVDFGKNGKNRPIKPRPATAQEISGHLNVLKKGEGEDQFEVRHSFKSTGWTFRKASKHRA
ncbi:MAG: hypothetical protein AAFZ15_31920 [Bacteroidota bacterium]